MIDISKRNISAIANNTGFIKDNLEKVMRLIDILETIYASEWKDKFVIKGGTAINLFYRGLPRLSVDIDLDYVGKTKDDTIKDKELFNKYVNAVLFQKGYTMSDKSKKYYALDSYVLQYLNNGGNRDNIKIEINYLDRMHILPTVEYVVSSFNYNGTTKITTMNAYELYGSKLAALLGRSTPRDIYDVYKMIESGTMDNVALLKKCFIFYNCIGGNGLIADKDFSILDNVTKSDFDAKLKPVLTKKELFDYKQAVSVVKGFLDALLCFTDNEIQFISNFKNNKYTPELLFDGEYVDYAGNVNNHPMALWRCSKK